MPKYTKASEVRDFLFACLRFENPAGGEPIPYDEAHDDRDPVAFVPPPVRLHGVASGGWNAVWNEIVTIPHIDSEMNQVIAERDAARRRVDALIAGWGKSATLVSAVQWRESVRRFEEGDDDD